MSNIDELSSAYRKRLQNIRQQHDNHLQDIRQQHQNRLDEAIKPLFQGALQPVIDQPASEIAKSLQGVSSRVSAPLANRMAFNARVDLHGGKPLEDLDAAFVRHFRLGDYYPLSRLDYPTVYCETLEEFFTPFVSSMDVSPANRKSTLDEMVSEAQQHADRGGIFGVNIPAHGCYLNGWLFAYGKGIPPAEVLNSPALLQPVLSTAAHEKLGHGFLSAYSALGQVRTSLGLHMQEIARRFGMRTADDPLSRLRLAQHNLLHTSSQLLEEGWSNWVARALTNPGTPGRPGSRHSLENIVTAIKGLPQDLPDRNLYQQALLGAMLVLFGEKNVTAGEIHQAVLAVEYLGMSLEDVFSQSIGQPLCYAVGELLMLQAESNQGALCCPYTALISANVTFDPAQISLTDLEKLFSTDPRLNPDTRLAQLSRLHLKSPGSIAELASRAENELNLAVPPAIH